MPRNTLEKNIESDSSDNASMRPRRNAAEYGAEPASVGCSVRCFNEAAA